MTQIEEYINNNTNRSNFNDRLWLTPCEYQKYLIDNESGYSHIKILPHLKHIENGFYVEAGACDGSIYSASNTLILNKCGWKGLLIEPATPYHKKLIENRKDDIIEKCALVSFEWGQTTIQGFNSGPNMPIELQGFNSRSNYIQIMEGSNNVTIPCYTFTQIARRHNINKIDFFSLDTEGYEMNILKGINFDIIDISYFLIELNPNKFSFVELNTFMEKKGYSLVSNISGFDINSIGDFLYKKNN